MMFSINKDKIEKTDEKVILLLIIGGLESVKKGVMEVEEIEKLIFSPYSINLFSKLDCDKRIIELLEKGCELEDLYSLVPEVVDDTIESWKKDALNCLKDYPVLKDDFWLL